MAFQVSPPERAVVASDEGAAMPGELSGSTPDSGLRRNGTNKPLKLGVSHGFFGPLSSDSETSDAAMMPPLQGGSDLAGRARGLQADQAKSAANDQPHAVNER